MMPDKRKKNANWLLNLDSDGQVTSNDQALLAVLMDLRDELQRMNNIFHCPNALDIPHILRRIDANTRKPKRKKKVAAK